jgi:hypothetical protein
MAVHLEHRLFRNTIRSSYCEAVNAPDFGLHAYRALLQLVYLGVEREVVHWSSYHSHPGSQSSCNLPYLDYRTDYARDILFL